MEAADLNTAFMSGLSEANIEAAERAEAISKFASEGPLAKQRADTAAKAEARKSAKAATKAAAKTPAPAPTTAAPAPAAAATTEKEAKHKLLKRIEGYRKLCADLKPSGRAWCTASSSLQDIEDEVASAQHQLGEQPTTGLGVDLVVQALSGLEIFTRSYNPFALNLNGLGEISRLKQAEFAPLVEEFMIKHGASLSLPVEARLVVTIGGIVAFVHMANTNPEVAEALAKRVNAPAPPPGVGQGM